MIILDLIGLLKKRLNSVNAKVSDPSAWNSER